MLNVLGISITFIPSVILCGHAQLDYLAKKGLINYKFIPEHFLDNEIVMWADVLVFIRSDSDLEAYVSKIAREAGKRCVYVLDDDLLNVPDYASSYYYYSLPSTHKNMKKVMANCDTFLTPSPVLMEKYGEPFKHKFFISEPSLNRIQHKYENDKVRIGFAGSIDRAKDINDILEDTIRKLVKKYGDEISIEFMGAEPSFVRELGLKHYPYQDGYDTYTAYMAKCNWDIGLAPMPESEFHRCKYFNKFVEYASFGIVGVYSNVEPYIYGIKNEVNGLLVENTTEAWFEAICRLIEDRELRLKLSDECIRQANEVYSLDVLSDDYLKKITADYVKPEVKKISSFGFVKKTFTVKRLFRKIREKGLDFPEWLVEKLKDRDELKKERKWLISNTGKVEEIVNSRDTVIVLGDGSKRSEKIKDVLKTEYFLIDLNGEDRALDCVRTLQLNDNYAKVCYNSYTLEQCSQVISMMEKVKCVIVCGTERFLPEKLGVDMEAVFDNEKIRLILDSHGNIPEYYHEKMNFYLEEKTGLIEKRFVDSGALIIAETDVQRVLFNDKYGLDSGRIMVIDNGEIEDKLLKMVS